MTNKIKKIYLAGGCFWGVEAYFSRVKGVIKTAVGYANGKIQDPTYEKVCSGETNFAETVLVEYKEISLKQILQHFFSIVDPTTLNKQAHDVGTQYRSGIFYVDENDREIIESIIKEEQKKYSNPIVTEVKKLENFYKAEEYHQKYLDKNPQGYCHIDLSKINNF